MFNMCVGGMGWPGQHALLSEERGPHVALNNLKADVFLGSLAFLMQEERRGMKHSKANKGKQPPPSEGPVVDDWERLENFFERGTVTEGPERKEDD